MKDSLNEGLNIEVDVIIPAYNAEETISRCIESVVTQSYRNIRVIIVNDGSTDRTAEICAQWTASDARVSVISTPNSGPASARNTGLMHVTGDWVLFLDSDDELQDRAIGRLAASCNGADLVAFGWNTIRANRVRTSVIPRFCGVGNETDLLAEILTGPLKTFLWSFSYSTPFLRSHCGDNEFIPCRYVLFEDGVAIHRLLRTSHIKVYFLQEKLVSHYEYSSSLSSRADLEVAKSGLLALEEFIKMSSPDNLDSLWRGKCVKMALNTYEITGLNISRQSRAVRLALSNYLKTLISEGPIDGLNRKEKIKLAAYRAHLYLPMRFILMILRTDT